MAVGTEWDRRMKAMIEALKKTSPATEPFELAPGSTVFDPVKFHESLLSDAAGGPRLPRSRTGAFQQDLERYLTIRGAKWDTQSVNPATGVA